MWRASGDPVGRARDVEGTNKSRSRIAHYHVVDRNVKLVIQEDGKNISDLD